MAKARSKQRPSAEEDTASRRRSRGTKVTKEEWEAARQFLKTDPYGQKLKRAEHILTALLKEELPRVRRLLVNRTIDLRGMIDPEKFDEVISNNPNLTNLLNKSAAGAYVKVDIEKDNLTFYLFYDRRLNEGESSLFSKSLGEILRSTDALFGLEVPNKEIEDADLAAPANKKGNGK